MIKEGMKEDERNISHLYREVNGLWINKPFFKYAAGILLTILIIISLGKIDYVLWPIQKTIATVFFPIIIAGLLYYIIRPVVTLLSRYLPKTISILTVFLAVIGIIFAIIHFGGPSIAEQIQNLSEKAPQKVKELTNQSQEALDHNNISFLKNSNLKEKALSYFNGLSKRIAGNVIEIFTTITSIAAVLIIVPFLLFYFLKDDHKLRPFLLKYLPDEVCHEGNLILKDVDKTLSTYIIGQFIIAVVDGVLMYIGYLIIGLDYALVLAAIATCLTVVPVLGPFMGVIPALLIAFQMDPFMAVKVLIVLLAVQQAEGHLVTPFVMGKRLSIHPITIILLLLVANSIYGFVGIIIAIPLYSVIKTIIKNFRRFYQLKHMANKKIVNISKGESGQKS